MAKTIVWLNDAEFAKPSHERRATDGPCQIVITPTAKHRMFADRRGDEWAVLHRASVPNLTDSEWYAAPHGDGWRLAAEREEETACP